MSKPARASQVALAIGLGLAALPIVLVSVSRAHTPPVKAEPASSQARLAHAGPGGEGSIASIEPAQLIAGVTDTFCLVYTATRPMAEIGATRASRPCPPHNW